MVEFCTGCWTCRFRGIDCDSSRPVCTNCKSLRLPCEGYGQKPEWMDGGERGARYLRNIEAIVAENSRRSIMGGPGKRTRHGAGTELITSDSVMEMSSSATSRVVPSHTLEVSPAGWSPLIAYQPIDVFAESLTDTDALIFKPGEVSSPMFDVSSVNGNSLPSPTNDDSTIAPWSLCTCGGPWCHHCLEQGSLLMRYLTRTFVLQFPLYGRDFCEDSLSWFYILFKQSTLFQYSTLSLGAYHQNIGTQKPASFASSDNKNDSYRYNVLCLQELQNRVSGIISSQGTEKLMTKVEILVSIIQLMFFEAFDANPHNWRMHMDAMSNLVLGMAEEMADIEINPFPSPQDSVGESHPKRNGGDGILPFYTSATSFLASVVVWLDVMSSSLLRTEPRLAGRHRLLLGNNISSISVFGCQNWVALAIAQVCEVEAWKNSKIPAGSLSNIELISKATELVAHIKSNIPDDTEESINMGSSGSHGDVHTKILTRVFAYAALIYLHVVVSGAHTKVPETHAAVVMSIDCLQKLSPSGLSLWVAWPMCIIGCMASEEFHEFFTEFVLYVDDRDIRYPVFRAVQDIWTNCWRMRKDKIVDWTSAMNQS